VALPRPRAGPEGVKPSKEDHRVEEDHRGGEGHEEDRRAEASCGGRMSSVVPLTRDRDGPNIWSTNSTEFQKHLLKLCFSSTKKNTKCGGASVGWGGTRYG
jgi:hypothetical protein